MMSADRTAVVADGQIMPTAEFVANNAVNYNTATMQCPAEGECAIGR